MPKWMDVHVGNFFPTEQFSILSQRLLNEKEKKNVYFAWNFPHSLDRSCLKVDFHINYQKTIIMDIKKSSWNCEIFIWSLLYQFTLMDSFLLSLFSDFSFFFLFSFPFKNRNFFSFWTKYKKKFSLRSARKIFQATFSTQIFSNKNFFYIIFVLIYELIFKFV
jgi:hypothetical protein